MSATLDDCSILEVTPQNFCVTVIRPRWLSSHLSTLGDTSLLFPSLFSYVKKWTKHSFFLFLCLISTYYFVTHHVCMRKDIVI